MVKKKAVSSLTRYWLVQGGLRFHPTATESVVKFLGFTVILLKNSPDFTLPMLAAATHLVEGFKQGLHRSSAWPGSSSSQVGRAAAYHSHLDVVFGQAWRPRPQAGKAPPRCSLPCCLVSHVYCSELANGYWCSPCLRCRFFSDTELFLADLAAHCGQGVSCPSELRLSRQSPSCNGMPMDEFGGMGNIHGAAPVHAARVL